MNTNTDMRKHPVSPVDVLTGLPKHWFWVAIPDYVIDWAHPWPDAAICEAENDGSGFAVQGKDIVRGACTWIDYTNQRGETKRIAVAGWDVDKAKQASDLASRITMFGKQVVCSLRNSSEYKGLEWDGALYVAMMLNLNRREELVERLR